MEEVKTQELVTKPLGVDRDGTMLVRWPHEYLKEHEGLSSSFGEDDPKVRLWVLSVWESECDKGATWIGRTMKITDFIVGPVTMIDEETGEETDGYRTLFIGPDHPPVAFVAKAALDALRKISKAVGYPPPWEPPVEVLVKQVAGRGARRTYKFIPQVERP